MILRVEDYGAVGNGIADDTTAIQNAINAASSAGGGIIVLEGKTYGIGSSLKLKSNVTITGTHSSILKYTSGNTGRYYLLGIVEVQNVTIRGITIDTNYDRPNYDIKTNPDIAVYIGRNSKNIRIQDNRINSCGIWSIDSEVNSTYTNIERLYIERNVINYRVGKNSVTPSADGFSVDTTQIYIDAKDYWIKDNIIHTDGTDCETAIEAHRRNGTVTGNIITGFRNGIIVVAGEYAEVGSEVTKMNISDNQLFAMRKGINIWQSTDRDLENIIISRNSIELDPARFPLCRESKGIFLLATLPGDNNGKVVRDIHVSDNIITFKPFSASFADSDITIQFVGIAMRSWVTIENISIINNQIKDVPATGILVGNSAGTTFSNYAKNIVIRANMIINAGANENITAASFNPRTAIRINGAAGHPVSNTIISDNTIIDEKPTGTYFTTPIYMSSYDIATCVLRSNDVLSAGTAQTL